MARIKPIENNQLLQSKLNDLNVYLSHRERMLRQFVIDIAKAEILDLPGEIDDFVSRVFDAIDRLYSADFATSLIANDLVNARVSYALAYNTNPEWIEKTRARVQNTFDEAVVEADFDSMLRQFRGRLENSLRRIRMEQFTPENAEVLKTSLVQLMNGYHDLLDLALQPARYLREEWLQTLAGQSVTTGPVPGRPRKAGRPKDEKIERRNRKIYEAWQTNRYESYEQIGNEFVCSADTVRKAIRKIREQEKKEQSK